MANIDDLMGEIDRRLETSPTKQSASPDDLISEVDRMLLERGGPTKEAAIAKRAADIQRTGGKVIQQIGDGTVYQRENGELAYVSPGYSTSDREKIVELMRGQTPADLMKLQMGREQVEQNPVAARANEFVRGTPFVGSYIDEAVGAVSPKARDAMRASTEAMQTDRPGQTTALNIAGGVAGSIPAAVAAGPAIAARAPVSPAMRAISGVGAGIAAGGSEGLVYGFGEGQGDERLQSAKFQGAAGAALGGIFGGALPLSATAWEAIVKRYKPSAVSQIADEFGVSQETATMLKRAFQQNDSEAAQRIMRAGPDATLADAGRSGQALLDATAQTGGRPLNIVESAVEPRAANAMAVANQGLDEALGPVRGPRQAAREVAESTAPARRAAYDAAYATPINYASDTGRAVEDVLSRLDPEDVSKAVRRANRQMRLDKNPNRQILFDADSGTFREMPNVQQLDEIKKALDGMGQEAVDNFGRLTPDGQYYTTAAEMLREATKDATGGPKGVYARALAEGQGKIQMDQGLQLGRDMLRKSNITREVFKEEFEALPKDAQMMTRVGLRSYIDDVLSRVSVVASDSNIEAREARKALAMLSSRDAQDKLAVLLGDDAADLINRIKRTQSALEMRASVADNSATAIRKSIHDEGKDVLAPGMVGSLARGEPVDATKRLTQNLLSTTPAADLVRADDMWSEIATVLTKQRGSREAQRALQFVEKAIAGEPLSEAQVKFIVNQVTTNLAFAGQQASEQAASSLLPQ